MAERVRVELGFDSGQVVVLQVDPAEAERLEQALAAGDEASIPLTVEDGRVTVAVKRLTYMKRYSREARVGFGAG